jgi:uncharacterized protein YndB with AHSA1/START domain
MTAQLTRDAFVAAPPESVFAAVTDWTSQGSWLPLTRVRVLAGDGCEVGSRIEAATGVRPAVVVDTMEITRFAAPHRVDLRHTGRLVRGSVQIEVLALPGGTSRVVWTERLHIPGGRFGALAWPVAGMAFGWGLGRSLDLLAHLVETGTLPRDAG